MLTEAVRDLLTVVVTLRQWGERHAFASNEAHSTLVDQAGNPVPEVVLIWADGAALDVDTTHVEKVLDH